MLRYADGISAIDTEYVRPMQDASHLIVEDGRAAFVDTGTNNSVPLLLQALQQHDLDRGDVDYVILTHIHLDHAGGAGSLMQALPNARCVVHPRGARHMANPEKLIAGTIAVYGEAKTREMYGDILPIEEQRIVVPEDESDIDLNGRRLHFLYTEGHARHHFCIHDEKSQGIFTGDSFGISYRELDTDNGEFIFPTSTPVHFDPEEAHKSVDRIMAIEPQQLFLTHYSRVTDLQRLADDMHQCIDAYVAMAREHDGQKNRTEALRSAMFEYLVSRLLAHGFTGSRDAMWDILELDITLNTQGLEVWLDYQKKA
jgi:glyoxylase-like metal-dependent hydrolase (beta-lactamase superfamily II)